MSDLLAAYHFVARPNQNISMNVEYFRVNVRINSAETKKDRCLCRKTFSVLLCEQKFVKEDTFI